MRTTSSISTQPCQSLSCEVSEKKGMAPCVPSPHWHPPRIPTERMLDGQHSIRIWRLRPRSTVREKHPHRLGLAMRRRPVQRLEAATAAHSRLAPLAREDLGEEICRSECGGPKE